MTKISTHDTSKPRHSFSDEKWALVEPHIPARKGRPGGDVRMFLDAIFWIGATGSPWREMGIYHPHARTRMRAQGMFRLAQGLTLQQVPDEFEVHLNIVEN